MKDLFEPVVAGLIESMWNSSRLDLINFISELIKVQILHGEKVREEYFTLLRVAATAPHEYTNPWDCV